MRIEDALLEQVRSASAKKNTALFVVEGRPSEVEIEAAQAALGISLPESYRQFVSALGNGAFGDELRLLDVSELYVFDSPGTEFTGFLVFGTDGLGNALAFDPRDAPRDGELPVYYLCHDPFGFGRVSSTFADFILALTSSGFVYEKLIENLPTFREVPFSSSERPAKASWWSRWWKKS